MNSIAKSARPSKNPATQAAMHTAKQQAASASLESINSDYHYVDVFRP